MTAPRPAAKFLEKLPVGMTPGIAAGLAAGVSRLHPEWAPLQLPALALLAWSFSGATGLVGRLRPGAWFGAAMAALVLGNVGVPMQAAAILFLALSGYWMLLGAGLSHLLQRPGLAGILGAAGLITLGEWAQSEALPMFGTAQRLASAWVDYDVTLPVSRIAGTVGVTFVVGAVAFAISNRAHARRNKVEAPPSPPSRHEEAQPEDELANPRRPESGEGAASTGWFNTIQTGLLTDFAIIGAVIAAIPFTMFLLVGWLNNSLDEKYAPTLTVAVCGVREGGFLNETDFLEKYLPMVDHAAAKGAKLVVTPEMELFVESTERDAILARLAKEAKRRGVTWVVGYAQSLPKLNRAVILNADNQDSPETSYDKTHWVPFHEIYARHGDGAAVTGKANGAKIGLMICQDDNYEDVSRNLSHAGVQVAAVPTFDWPGVEHAHQNSARNRPREFGFIEARAAIGGISAIIDTTGRIVASRNHLVEGDGVVVATLTLPAGGPTPFARFGDLPPLLLSGALVANALRRKKGALVTPSPAP